MKLLFALIAVSAALWDQTQWDDDFNDEIVDNMPVVAFPNSTTIGKEGLIRATPAMRTLNNNPRFVYGISGHYFSFEILGTAEFEHPSFYSKKRSDNQAKKHHKNHKNRKAGENIQMDTEAEFDAEARPRPLADGTQAYCRYCEDNYVTVFSRNSHFFNDFSWVGRAEESWLDTSCDVEGTTLYWMAYDSPKHNNRTVRVAMEADLVWPQHGWHLDHYEDYDVVDLWGNVINPPSGESWLPAPGHEMALRVAVREVIPPLFTRSLPVKLFNTDHDIVMLDFDNGYNIMHLFFENDEYYWDDYEIFLLPNSELLFPMDIDYDDYNYWWQFEFEVYWEDDYSKKRSTKA